VIGSVDRACVLRDQVSYRCPIAIFVVHCLLRSSRSSRQSFPASQPPSPILPKASSAWLPHPRHLDHRASTTRTSAAPAAATFSRRGLPLALQPLRRSRQGRLLLRAAQGAQRPRGAKRYRPRLHSGNASASMEVLESMDIFVWTVSVDIRRKSD
jgi:hypothetical protein